MTINEIARLCNVSPATVSNVINGKGRASRETAERIMKVIEETGYRPNLLGRSLRSHSTGLIGLIADDIAQFTSPAIINGVMACCEERGYHLILENLRLYARWSDSWFHDDEKCQSVLRPALNQLVQFRVDGILYVGGHERLIHGIDSRLPVPTVIAYGFSEDPEIPSFVVDDEQGSYLAARHLLDMGHRKIGYMAAERDNFHVIDRVRGYARAMEEAGLAVDESLIHYGHWRREGGYALAPAVLGDDISAVLCAQDFMAGGLYDYMAQQNLTPGRDLSVVGYDNERVSAYLRPELTTVSLPLEEIGFRAASCLLDRINGESVPSGLVMRVSGRLVERKSVTRLEAGE